jgi:hypothetical protein
MTVMSWLGSLRDLPKIWTDVGPNTRQLTGSSTALLIGMFRHDVDPVGSSAFAAAGGAPGPRLVEPMSRTASPIAVGKSAAPLEGMTRAIIDSHRVPPVAAGWRWDRDPVKG